MYFHGYFNWTQYQLSASRAREARRNVFAKQLRRSRFALHPVRTTTLSPALFGKL